ncbi:lysoplasmalogenase family protein [Robertkochia solimangrovi]|uniref:lysoplasmalogenase family protein n=1 Tax=Robertkochia solimangrovi TaxID=2213046 RepID=UPI0013A58141|nr:lysoplasmalogenase family protein [Robertkochia solimangrovi]
MLFRSERGFTILFIAMLIIDIVLNNIAGMELYGYTSKLVLLVFLLTFFLLNSGNLNRFERGFITLALIAFLAGEYFIMAGSTIDIFTIGCILIVFSKLLYCCAFIYRVDYDIDRILPYLVFTTLYSLTVIYFLYDLPGHLPAFLFLVFALIVVKFAYLRFDRVDPRSFWLVMSGAILFLVSETVFVFHSEMRPFSSSSIFVLSGYGLAQYLIILGMLEQNTVEVSK